MFDIAPTELLLVAIVALLVIGPKDLPKAMRFVGHWVGRARGVARQFRSGFDAMVREAELAEMEKKWAEENARIMRENPFVDLPPPPIEPAALPAPSDVPQPAYDEWGNPLPDAPAPTGEDQPVVPGDVASAQDELPLAPPAPSSRTLP